MIGNWYLHCTMALSVGWSQKSKFFFWQWWNTTLSVVSVADFISLSRPNHIYLLICGHNDGAGRSYIYIMFWWKANAIINCQIAELWSHYSHKLHSFAIWQFVIVFALYQHIMLILSHNWTTNKQINVVWFWNGYKICFCND